MRTPYRYARFLAAVMLSGAAVTSPPVVGDDTSPTISFRVVEPDGRPAASPTVVVTIDGIAQSQTPTILRGSPHGQVEVPLSALASVAADRLAQHEVVNLLIRVFDKPPGADDINSAYVTAAIGVDSFGVLRELSDVTGQSFVLEPGRTAFRPLASTMSDLGGAPVDGADEDTDFCPEWAYPIPRICAEFDYPDNVEHVLVPIAINHGAGTDFVSELRYNSTLVTQMSTAMEVGASGFFRTYGQQGFAVQQSGGIGFADAGPNDNNIAVLDTEWERARQGFCMHGPGGWQCQIETRYTPYIANGGLLLTSWSLNDTADPVGGDCWTPVSEVWEPLGTFETVNSFSLTLGGSETWAAGLELPMYANTTITQQTMTKEGYVRAWRVDGSTYKFHYVFVPVELRTEVGCVRHNVAYTWTHASDVDFFAPVEPLQPVVGSAPRPPNEGEVVRPICRRMPDQCD